MLGLYDVHLAPDGRSVDYPALVRDPNFADYTTAATELQKVWVCAGAPASSAGWSICNVCNQWGSRLPMCCAGQPG